MINALTAAERNRLSRFRESFNRIEQFIKRQTGPTRRPFLAALKCFSEQFPEWKHADRFHALSLVRNELAHAEGTDAVRVVPTEYAIVELSRIEKSITWLGSVGSRFRGSVECVEMKTSFPEVLRLIRTRDFSQFPIIDGHKIRGLLTENGVSRWLAKNFDAGGLTNLKAVLVRDVIEQQEGGRAFNIVTPECTVESAVDMFAAQPDLEAVLIVENRSRAKRLVGIVTRWDILQVRNA